MDIFNSIITWVMKKRIHQIELFIKYPHEVQQELLNGLITRARDTVFGKEHGFSSIKTYREYKNRVPVTPYEGHFPYIKRIMHGEQNVLWPSEIKWFAKSSGTTNTKSKFIPVSPEALEDCHLKGGKDMLSIYLNDRPDSKMFVGKGLSIGGSHEINQLDPTANSKYGDVSAVIMQNMPLWAKYVRTPSEEVALLSGWEEKLERMAAEVADENVSSMAGVPTWSVLVLQRVMEIKGVDDISAVWPNLEIFFHGAVAFAPYRDLFKSMISSPRMQYMETYNASEGFFGLQDSLDTEDLLLMLDYGIFYEFIPMDSIHEDDPPALQLEEVELGKNYAMVISTNAGLWRYKIGDTVRFTSLNPFRIRISGRTRHFINAFGEELIVENAEQAISAASEATHATIDNFTAAPIYLKSHEQGGHEWIIEFSTPPDNLDEFINVLDNELKLANSDYEAKRQHDMALTKPKVVVAEPGTFYTWMKNRGKLGGQNKVPRLCNDRKYVDELLAMLGEKVS